MTTFTTSEQYEAYLNDQGNLPEGFRVATAGISFLPRERPVSSPLPMRMTLVLMDRPTENFGAMFTRNIIPGAPVIIGRRRLSASRVRGVLINNKVSNVCAPRGVEDAEALLDSLGAGLGVPGGEFFPASTGIIGWGLPFREMKAALPELTANLHTGSCLDAARAIMTTDSYPKLRSVRVGEGTLLGFAKGAGMIEPNLATMLVFLLTDIVVSREVLRRSLERAAEKSFNCISVDGDQSTSDTVLLLSSGIKPAVPEEVFEPALQELCLGLARDIVRNGEGTGHVIRVSVTGAPDYETARNLGKAIVNSPLVKTAVFGNDPNVGRVVSAVGDFAGNAGLAVNQDFLRVELGAEVIFAGGAFRLDAEKEKRLSDYLQGASMNPERKKFPPHDRTVDIDVTLGDGNAGAVVYGSDLSYDYVRENADYRS